MPAGRRAFVIGEYSGEDDDDPNVATRDRRAPPQGSTAPWWWGTSDGGCGIRVVVRAAARGYFDLQLHIGFAVLKMLPH